MKRKAGFLRQRRSWDCGVATAAMVAGLSYSEVYRRLPGYVVGRGVDFHDMRRLLEALTGKRWKKVRKYGERRIIEHEFEGICPFVVSVYEYADHWVAAGNGFLYNPNYYGAVSLKSDRSIVAGWLKPED